LNGYPYPWITPIEFLETGLDHQLVPFLAPHFDAISLVVACEEGMHACVWWPVQYFSLWDVATWLRCGTSWWKLELIALCNPIPHDIPCDAVWSLKSLPQYLFSKIYITMALPLCTRNSSLHQEVWSFLKITCPPQTASSPMRLRSPPLPPCRVPPNACLLELRKCEATVLAQLGIVLHSWCMHSGPQGLEWLHTEHGLWAGQIMCAHGVASPFGNGH